MLLSLDSGVSALDQFQQNLNVIGNNIANVNTVGFKSASVNFADALSQTLGSRPSGSMQVGTGVTISGIVNQFTQGAISSTGSQSDLAINGNGFFLVNDPVSGQQYATRDGQFTVDPNGYLITSNGMRVQGYTDGGLTATGDIRIDNTGATTTDGSGNAVADSSAVQSYTIGSDGKINVLLTDGTQFTRGQILLQNFSNPEQLTKAGNNLFSGLSAAGPMSQSSAPSSSGLGNLISGAVEMSNVDLAGQLTSLITTQRAYEANTKVITTSDEILQDLVNLKR
jgi:flagellar hook protein FlgE